MPDAMPMPELASAPTFRQQVLVHLRERIMSGELAPGTLLTPTTVAKQLNTSAMPVREALRALEQEGLVEVSGRRYTRVATPSRAVADEAYPLLWLLEGHAIRQAGRLPESALGEADQANAALAVTSSTAERLRGVFRFHRAICGAAGPTTQVMLDMLYARVGLLESVYHRTYEPGIATGEHAEVVAAIRRGDVAAAAELNEAHWRRGYAAVLPFLDEA